MEYRSQFNTQGLSPAALEAWSAFEQRTGRAWGVNSAYRDPGHNQRVGGANNSQHTHGNAFDVDVRDLSHEERNALIRQAREVGFGGIGVYDNSLHFDVGATRHWGPSYRAASLPSWAAEAVGASRGQAPTGQQPQGGNPQGNVPRPPAWNGGQPQQPENTMVQQPLQPPTYQNSLAVADFVQPQNALALQGYSQFMRPNNGA